jgi:hypothetical protein
VGSRAGVDTIVARLLPFALPTEPSQLPVTIRAVLNMQGLENKVVLVIKQALCSEDVWGSGDVAPCIFNLAIHLQLVPMSRKYGSIHPLPHTPSWRSA